MRMVSGRFSGRGLLWLMGADAFALSGTIKDNQGVPVAGALVSLASDSSVRGTSDANGEFTLDKPVSINGRESPPVTGRNFAGLGIRGNRFQLLIPSSVPAGSITLSAIDGKMRIRLPLGPLEAGAHLVDLPELAPGVYSLRIALDRFLGSAHLVHAGNRTILMRRTSGDRHASEGSRSASALRRQATAAVDTLLVRKAGFVTARSPITSYDQTGITVKMVPDTDAVSPLPPTADYSAPGPFNTEVEADAGPDGAYAAPAAGDIFTGTTA